MSNELYGATGALANVSEIKAVGLPMAARLPSVAVAIAQQPTELTNADELPAITPVLPSTAPGAHQTGKTVMENGSTITGLLRLVGVMAVAVAAAWLVQVLDFGGSSALGRMAWVLAAAMAAGGGTGLIFTSLNLRRLKMA